MLQIVTIIILCNIMKIVKKGGLVPFVATPLKGSFVGFSKWLLIGYFRLGYIGLVDCPAGLGN